ncbi:MAG: efflux RND transporter periplasmic adaptor subunit, partial [Rubrivivax sp.]
MKKIHTVVAVVGIVGAAATAWWWQHRAPAPAGVQGVSAPAAPGALAASGSGSVGGGGLPGRGGPATVEVAKARTLSLTDDAQAVGSLKSVQGVMLRPEVSGRVSRIGFTEGQTVKRGQVLVQLDDTLQRAQLQQAEAQASIARTNLQRSRDLLGQGFISQSAVDQNASGLEVAEAQVALAQAQLARMRVVAPFDGTAGLRAVDVGAYVKDGADLVNLEDLRALTVRFALPERTIDRLRAGQEVELTVDALPGRTFKGRVQAIDSQVDANGRAVQVSAHVDNAGAVLRPGMFARARVVFAQRSNAVVVPEEALLPLGARQVLFKVVPGPDGKPVSQRLDAKVGLRLLGQVEILEGLQAGDTVVTAGHTRLLAADSVPVRPVDVAQAGIAKQSGPAGSGAVSGAGF